jgi:hypothetical protein
VFVKNFLGLFVFVALLLNACAPALPGSRYMPIDARETKTVTIAPGAEWFLKTFGYVEVISLKTRDELLQPLFKTSDIAIGNLKSRAVNWVVVQEIKAPQNWQVELVSQEALRKITDVGTTSYRFNDSLELNWLIKTPPTTPDGSYSVVVLLSNREDASKIFAVFLTIKVKS